MKSGFAAGAATSGSMPLPGNPGPGDHPFSRPTFRAGATCSLDSANQFRFGDDRGTGAQVEVRVRKGGQLLGGPLSLMDSISTAGATERTLAGADEGREEAVGGCAACCFIENSSHLLNAAAVIARGGRHIQPNALGGREIVAKPPIEFGAGSESKRPESWPIRGKLRNCHIPTRATVRS